MMRQFFLIDFDTLGECAGMIAAVTAVLGSHALAGGPGKRLESLRCDCRPGAITRALGPLCIKAGLVARGLQLTDAVLQQWVGQISDAILDGVVESLEFGVGLGRSLASFGKVQLSTPGALAAIGGLALLA
jgi:hypothetical protein